MYTVVQEITMIYRFWYDADTKLMVGKEINGPIIKHFKFSEDLDKFESSYSIEAKEYKNWCPILYYKKERIMFMGTMNYLVALTTDTRKIIGRFQCKGMPKSLCVVEEVDKLVLLSEEETARGDIHFLYTIDLS